MIELLCMMVKSSRTLKLMTMILSCHGSRCLSFDLLDMQSTVAMRCSCVTGASQSFHSAIAEFVFTCNEPSNTDPFSSPPQFRPGLCIHPRFIALSVTTRLPAAISCSLLKLVVCELE